MGGSVCNGRQIITNGYAPDRPLNQPWLLSISRFTGYEHKDYCYYYRRTTCVASEPLSRKRAAPLAIRKRFYFRRLRSRGTLHRLHGGIKLFTRAALILPRATIFEVRERILDSAKMKTNVPNCTFSAHLYAEQRN